MNTRATMDRLFQDLGLELVRPRLRQPTGPAARGVSITVFDAGAR